MLAASCARPKPSADYAQALNAWTMLVGQRGDEAALDPRSDQVLALLAKVPDSSLDAESAKDLRARIESERKIRAEERDRRAALVARAGAVPTMPTTQGPSTEQQGTPAPRAPSLAPGTKLEEFLETYGACFASKGSVELTYPDRPSRFGDMWAMMDDEKCREKHPNLSGKVALFGDGALLAVKDEREARTTTQKTEVTTKDVEVQKLPDGGLGIKTDGGVAPIPPDSTLVFPDGGRQ